MEIMKVNSRLPDFLRGRHVGRHRRRRASASGGSSSSSRSTALDTFATALTLFMDYGEQVVAARARGAAEGPLQPRGGAGQRRRLQRRRSRSPTTSSSSTCATTPTRTRARTTPRRDGVDGRRADDLQEHHRRRTASANAGHFRPLTLLTRPGLGLRREAARGVRHLLRGRDPALRPDLALPRAAPRRAPAGRAASRRSAARSSAARTPTPAATSRSSSRRSAAGARSRGARRQQRDLQRLPRRHLQLPGRGRRGALRAATSSSSRSTTSRGGEGEHRGGKGIVLDYRVRSDGCFFTCAYTRNKHPPWALDGGREGSPNYAEVIRADGTRRGARGRHGARGERGRRDPHPHRQRRRLRRPERTRDRESCSKT